MGEMTKPLCSLDVARNEQLDTDVYFLLVRGYAGPPIRPGQFVHVRCGNGLTLLRRPLSIVCWQGDELGLLYRTKGPGTQWLSEQLPGSRIDVVGPLGSGFFLDHPQPANLLLAAGGIGIASLLSLAQEMPADVTGMLLWGVVSEPSHLYRQFVKDFIPDGLELTIVSRDPTTGRGLSGGILEPVLKNRFDYMYACGPYSMLQALFDAGRGLVPSQMSLEQRMGCGFGACLGCSIPTYQGGRVENKRVCVDGPVFKGGEIFGGIELER